MRCRAGCDPLCVRSVPLSLSHNRRMTATEVPRVTGYRVWTPSYRPAPVVKVAPRGEWALENCSHATPWVLFSLQDVMRLRGGRSIEGSGRRFSRRRAAVKQRRKKKTRTDRSQSQGQTRERPPSSAAKSLKRSIPRTPNPSSPLCSSTSNSRSSNAPSRKHLDEAGVTVKRYDALLPELRSLKRKPPPPPSDPTERQVPGCRLPQHSEAVCSEGSGEVGV